MSFCPKCRTELPFSVECCEVCGAKAVDVLHDINSAESKVNKVSHRKVGTLEKTFISLKSFLLNFKIKLPKVKLPKKNLPIKLPNMFKFNRLNVVVTAVAILLVTSIISLIAAPKKLPDNFIYTTDNGTYFNTITNNNSKRITKGQFEESVPATFSYKGDRFFYVKESKNELIYKDIKNINKEHLTISLDVTAFSTNKKGDIVTYVKGANNELYQHYLNGQATKIDDNILWHKASDDGKKVLYAKLNVLGSQELWVYKYKDGTNRIVSDFDDYYIVNDEFSSIYYTSNGSIYRYTEDEEPEKIADKQAEIIQVYENGDIYYFITNSSTNGSKSLYYYNGKSSILLSDMVHGVKSFAIDRPVVVFYYDNTATGESFNYLAAKDKVTQLDYNISEAYLDATGDKFIFIATNLDEPTNRILYSATVSKKIKSVEKIDENVLLGGFVNDNKFFYFKNYNSEKNTAELYFDNKKVGTDVYIQTFTYIPKRDAFVFFKEVTEGNGTMFIYDNSKSKKVDNNVRVSQFFVTEDESIVYIRNFSTEDNCGELCVSKKNKGKLYFEGVKSIYKFKTQFRVELEKRGYII